MKGVIITILKVGLILIILVTCYSALFVEHEYWSGVYYPHGDSASNSIYSPRFPNKEECIGWAINERGLRSEDAGVELGNLWECNKNCKLAPEYITLIHSTQQYRQGLMDDKRGPLYVCDNGGFDGGDWLRGDF